MTSYQSITKKLETLREELTHRIDTIDADVHHKKEPVEKDFAEQVTQRENDDVLNALGNEAKVVVQQIDRALQRIKEDSYGICAECGNPISEKRLMVIPYVTLCIDCAE